MVVALRTHPEEHKDFELKGFMMKNIKEILFVKGKTQGYIGELDSEIIQQPFPSNGARNVCWYFLTHIEIMWKRTELPL